MLIWVAVALPGLALALTHFGCTVPGEFDPTGGDIPLEASWTIDGMAPTAEVCAAAGVASVQLRLWEEFPGGKNYTQDDWVVDCAAGMIVTQPELVPDDYRVALYALGPVAEGEDPDSGEVVVANIETLTATSGSTLVAMLDLGPTMEE